MKIIDREAPPHPFPPDEWQIVRRMIHTVGDFGIIETVRFSPDAVEAGIKALHACRSIYTDANMIRAGISLARLRSVCGFYRRESVICHVADEDVAAQGQAIRPSPLPPCRQKAKPLLEGAIAVIGNAPVALMELSRMIVEEGLRPSLVVALPVGFVHVVESKEELMAQGSRTSRCGTPGREPASRSASSTPSAAWRPGREKEKNRDVIRGEIN